MTTQRPLRMVSLAALAAVLVLTAAPSRLKPGAGEATMITWKAATALIITRPIRPASEAKAVNSSAQVATIAAAATTSMTAMGLTTAVAATTTINGGRITTDPDRSRGKQARAGSLWGFTWSLRERARRCRRCE